MSSSKQNEIVDRLRRMQNVQDEFSVPDAAAAAPQETAPAAEVESPALSDQSLILRPLCLNRLDPTIVLSLSAEDLLEQVEQVVDQVATEQRIQLNLREQRRIATELVHDMKGLGPIQPLLDDDSIADIMVNGPNSILLNGAGKRSRPISAFGMRATLRLFASALRQMSADVWMNQARWSMRVLKTARVLILFSRLWRWMVLICPFVNSRATKSVFSSWLIMAAARLPLPKFSKLQHGSV